MVFYKPGLMQNQREAILFMAVNPVEFTNFEDHQSAIYIQLHNLIEEAYLLKENPVGLIEDYLEIQYNEGDTPEDVARFLFQTGQMSSALTRLKASWESFDSTLPQQGESLMGSGMSSKEALDLYAGVNLRSFLEALSGEFN